MSHFVNVCEFGQIHGQCRCINRDKERRLIECPTPGRCALRQEIVNRRPRPGPGRSPSGNPRSNG